jgi:hypothetical protein
MNHSMIAGLAVLVTSLTVQGAEPKTGPDTPVVEKTNPVGQWRSEPPADCPFKPSAAFTGIEFTGRHSDYRCGDTFYPSWASENRTPELMKILLTYGTHAKAVIPELTKLGDYFDKDEKDFPRNLMTRKANCVRETIRAIEASTDAPELISIE